LQTVYNHYPRKDGLIWIGSLNFDEQKRARQLQFQAAAEAAKPLSPAPAPARESSRQLDLLPQTAEDRKLAEQLIRLPEPQRPVVMARFRAIKPTLNHDFKGLGYPRIEDYIRAIAPQVRRSQATVWRWRARYLEKNDLCALADERPGPEAAGAGAAALDASMRAHVRECWEIRKLTRGQTYSSLIGYLKDKQRGCGPAWVYQVPHGSTVYRFINLELRGDKNCWRLGAEAVKTWAGYGDRSYENLPSLGQVECDEFCTNLFSFEARNAERVLRYWLVTLFDTRSAYPLAWEILGAAEGAKKLHGITQRDEQRLFVKLVKEYGVPDSFYSDRGRFRASFWGGEPGARANRRDEEFARSDGIMESLGIRRRMPREKNPRGSRLERFHLFLTDKCRLEPGWVGATEGERKMAPGDRHSAEHADFVAGRRATTPLLTKVQVIERIKGWMQEWCEHASHGTGMNGLSPRTVFLRNMPPEGFRKLDSREIEMISAEWYPNRVIQSGGIVEVPDGLRYGLPGELTELQGTKRHVIRHLNDHSFVMVKGLRKGQPDMVAHLRPRLGMDDPKLGGFLEAQRSVRNIAEGRLGELSPESNTAEILEPYRAPMPARQRPRFADDVARDLLKREDSDASTS
jgi:hypothetical protein